MLKLDHINFSYHNQADFILRDFNLEIRDGEFLSLVGPSGCGKTTLVNIIAGYLKPDSGRVFVNGKNVCVAGKDRIVINQENDLFEWMTVYENMKLVAKKEKTIEKYLAMTNLLEYKNLYPGELSGGMKKRLSLARALAVDSSFIIMDEPFGSLDNQAKDKLQEEVLAIIKQAGKTILLVTHDVDEAIFLSDRILLLAEKPVIIKQQIMIDFPGPRTLPIKDSAEFGTIRAQVKRVINLL